MGEGAVTSVDVEAVRDEMRRGFDEVRREMDEVRRLVEAAPSEARDQRSLEEKLAGLERARHLREAILRRRGGEFLPPVAEEIARTRAERTARILRETAP